MQHVRGALRRIHIWLGLSIGALLVLLGLTGSALVFYQTIDTWLHSEIRIAGSGPGPGWESSVWDDALATVRAEWPDRPGLWRFESTGEAGALPARYQPLNAGHHGRRVMVWLTPDGQQVLREAEWGSYFATWVYDLHMDLLLHAPGRAFVGWSGVVIFVLLLTGLWAWWPRGSWRKALHFKRDAVESRRLRDIHKLAGLMGLPLLLMLVVTGVMLALPDESNAVLAHTVGPVVKVLPMRSSVGTGTQISIRHALSSAHQAMPLGRLAWVEVPGKADGVFMVRVQQPGDPSYRFPHSYVYVDQYSGQIVGMQNRQHFGTANQINNWLHPLHDASIGGLGLRLAVAFAGLVPMALFITGWMRWLARRRARVLDESARQR